MFTRRSNFHEKPYNFIYSHVIQVISKLSTTFFIFDFIRLPTRSISRCILCNFRNVFLSPEDSTLSEHIDAALCTMALLCVEARCDEVHIFFLALIFSFLVIGIKYCFLGVSRTFTPCFCIAKCGA